MFLGYLFIIKTIISYESKSLFGRREEKHQLYIKT